MAKKPAQAAAPVDPAAPLAFSIEVGAPPPAIQRQVGNTSSPYTAVLKALPAPDGDKIAQFFIPAEEPAAAITDPAERAKAFKESARKISNRVSGIARRLTGENDATGKKYAFALRTQEKDGKLGVRVYRVTPEVAAVAPVGAAPQA